MPSEFNAIWQAYIQPNLTSFVALIGAISASVVAWRFGSIQAAIAKQQAATAVAAAATARNKLKLELFDRRLAIYEVVLNHMHAVSANEAGADRTTFRHEVRAVEWLFGPEVSVWVYGELEAAISSMQTARQLVDSGTDDLAEITRATVLMTGLLDQYDRLADLFAPYLRLEH